MTTDDALEDQLRRSLDDLAATYRVERSDPTTLEGREAPVRRPRTLPIALGVAAVVLAGIIVTATVAGGAPHHTPRRLRVTGGQPPVPSPTRMPPPTTPAPLPPPAATTVPPVTTASLPRPRTTVTPAPTTTVAPAPVIAPPPSAVTTCSTADLQIGVQGLPMGSLEHYGYVIVFTNAGAGPCTLEGYPGVDEATGGMTVASSSRSLGGMFGGPSSVQQVTLNKGQTASALWEGLNAPAGPGTCPDFTTLEVTPPGETTTADLPWTRGGLCDPQIHPVVPGSTGDNNETG